MASRTRGYFTATLGLLLFGAIATAPWLLGNGGTPPWVHAAASTSVVPLPAGRPALPPVQLGTVALPVHPEDAPASLPTGDSTKMAALVAAEDNRLRVLLHHSFRLTGPTVVPVTGALPTLVLRARTADYTIVDLQKAGAVTPLSDGSGFLLVDSVLVAPRAVLTLGGPGSGLSNLLMDSSSAGFASLVTWGGKLSLSGDGANAQLNITGWDHVNNRPAENGQYGRAYIRSVGGRLELKYVHASSLGFWSGRTGGVAWTGINKKLATGSAVSSTFTGNTYGVFVSRADRIAFSDDLFEANQIDGLRLHRSANNSTVTGSAAVRNGGNGFVVGRGATGDALFGNVATHNAANGFLLNGQPLVSGASPSGDGAVASTGTAVVNNESRDNGRAGIIVEGGAGTVVQKNIVSSAVTGIEVRAGAVNTAVLGNNVIAGGRTALSIGPGVTGTTVAGNTFASARIGILIRNSAGVRIINDQLTTMSVFGISVRGASPGVVGNDNVISGLGLQAVDTRAGAPALALTTTDTRGWQHRSQLSVLGYLRYHPILTTWLAIVALVAISWSVSRLRRRPARPYKHQVPWHGHETMDGSDSVHELIVRTRSLATVLNGASAATRFHDDRGGVRSGSRRVAESGNRSARAGRRSRR